MTLPHPGDGARAGARVLFGLGEQDEPSVGQCWAAVDLAVRMRAAGMLPAGRSPVHVVYPERPGQGFCLCRGYVRSESRGPLVAA